MVMCGKYLPETEGRQRSVAWTMLAFWHVMHFIFDLRDGYIDCRCGLLDHKESWYFNIKIIIYRLNQENRI